MSRQRIILSLALCALATPVTAQQSPQGQQLLQSAPLRVAPGPRSDLPPGLADWAHARARGPAADEATLRAEADREARLQGPALDLANMPIEDAITMMMLLISEDARADTKSLLGEMNETRRRREALRREQELMRDAEVDPRARAPDQTLPYGGIVGMLEGTRHRREEIDGRATVSPNTRPPESRPDSRSDESGKDDEPDA